MNINNKTGGSKRSKSLRFWLIFVAAPMTVILCVLLAGFGFYLKKRSGKQGFERGLIYANLNRHSDAIAEFKKELVNKPDDANIHYYLGSSYSKIKEYEKAIGEFKTAIKIKPTFHKAQLQIAVTNLTEAIELRKLGKNESLALEKLLEAEDVCRAIINEKSDFIDAHTLLGEIHFSQGLIDDAIADYQHVIKLDNSVIDAHIALARLYMNTGKLDLAEKQCNTVLTEIDPHDYHAGIILSAIYEQKGKFGEAVKSIKQVLEKKADDVMAHTQLAFLYLKMSKYDEAYSEVERISKLTPAEQQSVRAAVSFIKGRVMLHRKKYIDAIIHLQEAVVRLPKLVETHYMLAIALAEGGRIEEAKSEFQAAINLAPEFVPPKLGLARLLTKKGWQKETIKLCNDILVLEPENVDAMQILSVAYMRENDFKNAEEILSKISSIRPSMSDVNVAYLSLESGQLSKCIHECEAIIKTNPKAVKVYDILGLAYIRRGSFDKGIEQFKKASELDVGSIISNMNLAKAYIITGNNKEAIKTLENLITLNSDNLSARALLSTLYEKEGDIGKAVNSLENVLRIDPDYLPGYALADLYYYQGRVEDSVVLYNKALKLDPDNAILHVNLAVAHQQLENNTKSISSCKKAIELKPEMPSLKIILTNIYVADKEFAKAKENIETISEITLDQKTAYRELINLCQLDYDKGKQVALALNKAMIARQRGAFDMAISECKKAVVFFPENIIPRIILASTYLSANQSEEAISIYTEVIKDKPESVSAYYEMGKAYLLADKKDEAISMYQSVVGMDSKSVPARLALAGLLLRKGSVDEAANMAKDVIELDPENLAAHSLLGEVNLMNEKYEQAELDFSRMIELQSDIFKGHYNIASMNYSRGNYDKCIESCVMGLKIKPTNVNLLNILGSAYARKGMLNNAVAEFNKIIDINSDFVPAYLNLANIYLLTGKPDISEILYNTSLKIAPDSADAHFGLGNSYAMSGNHSSALGEFESIIKSYPDKMSLFISMIKSYMAMGNYEKAKEVITNALSIEPENAKVRSLLAKLHVQNENIPLAIDQLKQVLSDNPKYLDAYELGILYLDNGEYDKSITVYRQGTENFPKNALLRCNLALAYLIKEDYENAKIACLKALKDWPDGIAPHLCMINLLLAKGDFEGARLHLKVMTNLTDVQRKNYKDLIESCSQANEAALKVSLHMSKALAYINNKWFKRSLREYREITKIIPADAFAYNARVDIFMLLGENDKALEACKELIKLEPESPSAYDKLADIHNRQGRTAEAEAQYRKIISIDPGNANAHLSLGMLLESMNRFEESIHSYQKVIELNPSSVAAYNNLALIYASRLQDKLKDALALAQKAMEFAPNNPAVIDTLGWVYCLNGMYDKAITELETAVKSLTWDPTIHYHLGAAYYGKERHREALIELERSLKIRNTFPEAENARELIEKIINKDTESE